MEFDPRNEAIQLCVQGIALEENGDIVKAAKLYQTAWDKAANDLERYLSAYFIGRSERDPAIGIEWFGKALNIANSIDSEAARSALPAIYAATAECYDELGDAENAKKIHDLAHSVSHEPKDTGPFYHGTRADLEVGDLLTPGGMSNYEPGLVMNHIYFTAAPNSAGLAAALAGGEGRERVYIVEPTGPFEHDPNVTDKKFPGNPTRSYRSMHPLKVTGEVADWAKQSSDDIQKWKERLAKSKGTIIN